MGKVDQPWREGRPLEYEESGQNDDPRIAALSRVVLAMVELNNRELSPLLTQLRAEAIRLGGAVQVLTADYDVLRSDHTMLVDASAAEVTLTMPPAADVQDYPFVATKTDSSSNNVILDFGTETCSGANQVNLTAQYVSVTVESDGVGYSIKATYP